MNTPSHLILSLFIWKKEVNWRAISAIIIGALLPDLPMIGFYLYQKISLGTPEQIIWSRLYFEPKWQLFFDWFNSAPLFLVLFLGAYFAKFRLLMLLSLSALIHLLLDFPLHHDDAHRHFLPFSNWRFISPVSYWDAAYFGRTVMWIEGLLTVLACLYASIKAPLKGVRFIAIIILLSILIFSVFAMQHWTALG